MTTLSKSGKGSALTSTTEATAHVTIAIPAQKGGRLTAIEITVLGTLETVVNSGGLVKFHNSSEHWEPFEFYIGPETCVTSGGVAPKPFRILCNKYLPNNSSVTVDYTPQDNQSQFLRVVLFWVQGESASGPETYSKTLIGAAVTATDRVEASTGIQITKAGRAKAVQLTVFGTLETVVNTGGLIEVEADGTDIKPSHFSAGKMTCVTAGGAEHATPYMAPVDWDAPNDETFHFYYTPDDNQSQKLAAALIWEA